MPYGYRGLKIFTSLSLRFQDFQRRLIIVVELPARNLFLRAWEVQVGRVSLYLLDSNDLMNSPIDRAITSELYGGGYEMRLLQEIVLGIGGWRLLEALEIKPEICHLN